MEKLSSVKPVPGAEKVFRCTLKRMHTGGGRGRFMRASQRGGGGVLEGSAAEALTLLLPVPGAGSAHGLPLPS